MKLFRISPSVQGRSRMEDFLRDCFVSIGYPGIGNLADSDKAQVSKRLKAVYGYEGNGLERRVADVHTFVRGMADGDYVVVPLRGNVWLGDLGDYYYRDDYDSPEEATCHRRGVTWLGVLPESSLNPLLRDFVTESIEAESGQVLTFPLPVELAGLESFAAQTPGNAVSAAALAAESAPERTDFAPPVSAPDDRGRQEAGRRIEQVDAETVREAIAVLKKTLRSDDPELRVRAAEALLRYAK